MSEGEMLVIRQPCGLGGGELRLGLPENPVHPDNPVSRGNPGRPGNQTNLEGTTRIATPNKGTKQIGKTDGIPDGGVVGNKDPEVATEVGGCGTISTSSPAPEVSHSCTLNSGSRGMK